MYAYEPLINKIDYRWYYFEGSCKGRSKGFPCKVYSYNTTCFGPLKKFLKGANKVGDWCLIFERHTPGAPDAPAIYKALYVREKDLEKAKNLLIVAGINKKFIL